MEFNLIQKLLLWAASILISTLFFMALKVGAA